MIDPYRILFPIGLAYGVWGTLLWIGFVLGWGSYPAVPHSFLMITGFLMSFIAGFMLTAIPRFTGSDSARRWELGLSILLATAPALAASGAIPQGGAFVGAGLQLLFLLTFFGQRFWKGSFTPPPQFALVALGLVCGLAGSVLLAGVHLAGWGAEAFTGGKVLLFQGTVLCPILGVGSRLITALLGWGHSDVIKLGKFRKPSLFEVGANTRLGAQGALLAVGFAAEFSPWQRWGSVLRAVAATWIAFEYWKLYRAPRVRGRLPNWLWISAWALVIGLWFQALVPSMGVHGLHLMFISGFGLLTLMVASRVILAHGGFGLELEFESKAIRWAGVLFLLAAVTRVTAPLVGGGYTSHLGYAAFLWLSGLSVWMWTFLPKIVRLAVKQRRTSHVKSAAPKKEAESGEQCCHS